MSSYSEKLRDPRWQKKRLQVMERDKFRCRICHSTEITLNVHHIKYEKIEPWEYGDKNLVTLCENCHGVVKHCETRGQRHSFEAILTQAWTCGKIVSGEYVLSKGPQVKIVLRDKDDMRPIRCAAMLGSPFTEKKEAEA